jgi:hypothetical protein
MVAIANMEGMMGFYKLRSDNAADQDYAGNGIIAVSNSAFDTSAGSEWKKFDANTRKWLYDHHYRYVDTNGVEIGDGKIPSKIKIVPVYDTETVMHVRIPWKGDLAEAAGLPTNPEPAYPNFKAFLARYFMRKCR